jgi:hypothetical protein
MNSLTKIVWTLDIGNYAPEIKALTHPLLRLYARKIGAEFYPITERRFPGWPMMYEKLQIYKLGYVSDWNIYIDSDCVVHPDMWDPTEHLTKDMVCQNGCDLVSTRWKPDDIFRRDGRHISSCNWFTCASNWCLDLWRPLDMKLDEALQHIFPSNEETNSGFCDRGHLIDDFALSHNIARFGLKYTTLTKLQAEREDKGVYLYHDYKISNAEKLRRIKQVIENWDLGRICYGAQTQHQPGSAIARAAQGVEEPQDAEAVLA